MTTRFMVDPGRACAPNPKNQDPVLDVESFFANRARDQKAAKQLCFRCPVRKECFTYALLRPGIQGIWGGVTSRERATIRRRNPHLVMVSGY